MRGIHGSHPLPLGLFVELPPPPVLAGLAGQARADEGLLLHGQVPATAQPPGRLSQRGATQEGSIVATRPVPLGEAAAQPTPEQQELPRLAQPLP